MCRLAVHEKWPHGTINLEWFIARHQHTLVVLGSGTVVMRAVFTLQLRRMTEQQLPANKLTLAAHQNNVTVINLFFYSVTGSIFQSFLLRIKSSFLTFYIKLIREKSCDHYFKTSGFDEVLHEKGKNIEQNTSIGLIQFFFKVLFILLLYLSVSHNP